MKTILQLLIITIMCYIWYNVGKTITEKRIQSNIYSYYGEGDQGLELEQIIIKGDTSDYYYK